MPRIPHIFRRHSDHWVVNDRTPSTQEPVPDRKLVTDNQNRHPLPSWSLLLLLLWKNYKLVTRNYVSTIAELLLPLLFTTLIVGIRFFGAETKRFENATVFEPFSPELVPSTLKTCCNEIYFAPDYPVVRTLMARVQRNHFNQGDANYTFTGFTSESDLLLAYANSSSGMYAETEDGELSSTVLAGIVFHNITHNGDQFPQHIQYSLRFPASLRSQSGLLGERFSFGMKEAWFTEILYPIIQPFGPRAKDQATGGEPGYWSEGFLYVQNAVESELVDQLSNTKPPQISLQRFPYPGYVDDEFLVVLQPFLPLTLILSFIYTATSITKTLVTEKERRIHESMKMMGMRTTLHWTAWFITFLILFSVSAALITALLKVHLTESSKSAGLAVLPNSDPSLVFFCLVVHGVQLIAFCFFISAVCRTANAAAISASILWFMLFLPFPFLQPRYPVLSSRVKVLWCVVTNMGICFCCQLFCMLEGSKEGAQWSKLFQGVTPDDSFSIADCLGLMLFNGIVYFASAVYVGAVWPGEFGVARPWYFPFTKRYWFGRDKCEDKMTTELKPPDTKSTKYYERSPKSLTPGIQVRDLRKIYGEVTAIDNLNLVMYQNETFCLLGKNGAGKSSLVSVLTGLYPPSTGTAVVSNHDVRTDMDSIRQSLGVCPQHNVLFDELSVEEHLQFFSALKGLRGKAVGDEVDRMVEAVGLEHKRGAQVRTLSGGMKRRLCVGIAFCAGSQVVMLDEPSSGLDVEARRAVWDLIQAEKVGRTVLLTTHFMEEAELLGDRIAIMVNGRVPCCGSPLFLNKTYNGGYNLTIVMAAEEQPTKIISFVRSYVQEAELIRIAGKELTFALPQTKCTEFPVLFDAMELRQPELGIETFGARLTSMEDVFIRANAEEEEEEKSAMIESRLPKNNMFLNNGSAEINVDDDDDSATRRNSGCGLMFQQFRGLVVKKAAYLWRRRSLCFGQTLIPMGYLSLVLVVLKTIPGIFDPPPHTFQLSHYELFGRTVTPVKCSVITEAHCSAYLRFVNESLRHTTELFDANASFIGSILRKEESDLQAFNSKYIIGAEWRDDSSRVIAFFNNQPLHTPPLALNAVNNAFLMNHTVRLTNHPFPYTNLDTQDTGTYWTVGFHVGYNTAFALTFVVAVFATFLVKEHAIGATHLQRISGMQIVVYWTANFVVDFVNYLAPCAGLLAVFALFSGSTDFLSWSLQGYLFMLFIAFGWALIPVVYIMADWFRVPAVGFAGCGVACAFSGFITILTVTVLELPQINDTRLATVLHRLFLVFPTYALGRGITQMSVNKQLEEKCAAFNLEFLCDAAPDSYCCSKLRPNYLDWEEVGIGKNLVYMVCVGALAMLVIGVRECRVVRMRRGKGGNPDNVNEDDEDDDVVAERHRVTTIGNSESMVIRDLTKSYGPVLAVNRLTVGVNEGECFGLLGTNGAGKTSTFRMLVGEIEPDSGEIFIRSHSVTHERTKTHRLIGYCPQFDALLGELTGRQTLTLFARLRGIHESEICAVVDKLATGIGFSQYLDRTVDAYSGGNRRKLSTAVALIGSPKVVFLDEPTAGMDPLARRQVWSAINNLLRNKQASVVLTSHSLEECEVLCTRLAIMKNGRMQCLGSPQQLKHKFGDGFSIVVQVKGTVGNCCSSDKQLLQRKMSNLSQLSSTSTVSSVDTHHQMQVMDSYIRSHFPTEAECVLTSSHANYLHYHLKQRKDAATTASSPVSWSTLFRTMESIKESAGISAYSVAQISLEQVFLSV